MIMAFSSKMKMAVAFPSAKAVLNAVIKIRNGRKNGNAIVVWPLSAASKVSYSY